MSGTNRFDDGPALTTSVHILCAGDHVSLGDLSNSSFASVRVRLAPAAEAAQKLKLNLTAGDDIPLNTDIVLVGKLFAHQIDERRPKWTDQLNDFSNCGGSIIVDYTDHHLAIPSPQSPFYSDIMGITDRITVASQAMKEMLQAQYDVPIHLIEDRLDFDPLAPKRPEDFSKTALWFGQRTNLKTLSRLIEVWPEYAYTKTLLVVGGATDDALLRKYLSGKTVRIDLQFMPWSIATLLLAARRADVAVIPSSLRSHKQFASSNRLVTSLTLGLPTVATPVPSYVEFKDCFAEFGTPHSEAVFKDPSEGASGVLRFQQNYMQRFSHHGVVEAWKAVLAKC